MPRMLGSVHSMISMAGLSHVTLTLFIIMRICSIIAQEEYCMEETFNPKCDLGDIILMRSALYGRMNIGRCLPTDYGNMGCQSDVLAPLDQECSGKATCNVLVVDPRITSTNGCLKGLLSYLQAEHTCVPGLNIQSVCTLNHQPVEIETSENDFYVTDLQLSNICPTNQGFLLKVKEGQVMNISQVNLKNSVSNDDVYGTVRDTLTDKSAFIRNGPREKQLFSSSNEVELKISDNRHSHNRFMLHVQVSGCRNMLPPEGAWMTRDGDIMEIGCHTGAKVWSLECTDNQWIGTIGQCGIDSGSLQEHNVSEKTTKPVPSLSMDAMLFGISSLVIFLSAVIFLTGVCLLKRKLRPEIYSGPTNEKAIPLILQQELHENNFPTLPGQYPMDQSMYPIHGCSREPGYKSLLMNQNVTSQSGGNEQRGPVYNANLPPAYINTAGSDASESVKYFVLEDAASHQ